MIKTTAAALALAFLAAAPAFAQAELSPVDIVNRHMAFAAAGNVDGMVGDYADDAVTLTAGKATVGKAALHAMFQGMLGGGAKPGVAAPARPAMKNLKIWSEGDVGFVAWEMGSGTPNAVKGTDAFLVRHGKILVQSVFIGGQQPAL